MNLGVFGWKYEIDMRSGGMGKWLLSHFFSAFTPVEESFDFGYHYPEEG
tara:strand:+ start:3462 stop:3608 length:147 start_codon:yes stop_codon:yes gene_type:complete